MFETNDIIETSQPLMGLPQGTRGRVIGRYTNNNDVVVKLTSGRIVRLPADAIELATRAQASSPGPAILEIAV